MQIILSRNLLSLCRLLVEQGEKIERGGPQKRVGEYLADGQGGTMRTNAKAPIHKDKHVKLDNPGLAETGEGFNHWALDLGINLGSVPLDLLN